MSQVLYVRFSLLSPTPLQSLYFDPHIQLRKLRFMAKVTLQVNDGMRTSV